ncbi:MAG: 4'-phosphopantetheinyl transferase superfamily protein [Clostridiales bacterium]|jgi:4'-phosphopantetheinyl transferase|nr:4'-phosphopantetheinyl transferase superfamily protein [Clostridiales bacterium]
MYIFSKDGFGGSKKESHELLEQAIDLYNNAENFCTDISGADFLKRLKTEAKGKPFIPGWKHFSISHSNDTWAILIDDEVCGMDIQYPRNCKMKEIMQKYYNEEEKAFVLEDGEEAFWEIWTRREAVIKAIGENVFAKIPSVLKTKIEIDGKEWFLQRVEILGVDEVPFGAICTNREPVDVHFFRL